MRSRRSLARWAAAIVTAALCEAACVDLFHETDFTTLCAADAAACAPEAAVVDVVVPVVDAGKPVDLCDDAPTEAKSHAARACAWMGACLGARVESSFGECTVQALAAYDCSLNPTLRPRGRVAEMWSCLAKVASCADVSRCVFVDAPPKCIPVDAGSFVACTTDTSTVVTCAATTDPVATEACVLEGRTCAAPDKSSAVCAGARGASCEGGATCSGTHASVCENAFDVGIDCAAFGAGRCVADDAGVACAPLEDAGACTGSSAVTCDDAGVATSCVGGRAARVDCTRLGGACAADRATTVAPLSACGEGSPATKCVMDACDGDVLRSCSHGLTFEIACASVGLHACEPARTVGDAPTCGK